MSRIKSAWSPLDWRAPLGPNLSRGSPTFFHHRLRLVAAWLVRAPLVPPCARAPRLFPQLGPLVRGSPTFSISDFGGSGSITTPPGQQWFCPDGPRFFLFLTPTPADPHLACGTLLSSWSVRLLPTSCNVVHRATFASNSSTRSSRSSLP